MSRVASRVGSRVGGRVVSRLGGTAIDTRAQFDLNFAAGKFWADGSLRTLSEVMDYTRPDPCWVVDSDYVLHEFAANEVPTVAKQFDGYTPFGEATNLLLNSDAPATQTVTVTDATAYTLSVWSQDGTGSAEVTTGGTGTATGNWRDQGHLTFTSSGTSVTVTVSGNVDYIQLEEGDNSTEYIKTGASAVTRSAFTQSEGTALIAGLLNDSEGTLVVECQTGRDGSADGFAVQVWDGTSVVDNSLRLAYTNPATAVFRFEGFSAGTQFAHSVTAPNNGPNTFALSYASGHFARYLNGALDGDDATYTTPTGLSTIGIGARDDLAAPAVFLNGRITRIAYYNTKGAV